MRERGKEKKKSERSVAAFKGNGTSHKEALLGIIKRGVDLLCAFAAPFPFFSPSLLEGSSFSAGPSPWREEEI